MKVIPRLSAGFLLASIIGYLILGVINTHIDRRADAIVQRTLADNAIDQLRLLSEIQTLIEAGDISRANIRLTESTDTLVYILSNYCGLPECEITLLKYDN